MRLIIKKRFIAFNNIQEQFHFNLILNLLNLPPKTTKTLNSFNKSKYLPFKIKL